MLKVGITGGIGSGKSTVSAVFVSLGIPFYNADARAKWLTEHHPDIVREIIALFGNQAYAFGSYNRKYIASLVFNDTDKLLQLNQIIHPRVEADYKQFCEEHKDTLYTLKEAAILFESGSYKLLDKTIMVLADKELRIRRVCKRDNISREDVLKRMEKQMPDEEKVKLADFVIKNNLQDMIIPQVIELHKQLSAIACE
ncbi:MAG: dephospho-CoA kinase [Bacteroidia bacterium]|nr:dephospho-CoA kinase [Bacteroidia bacterium]MCO5253401.1 dephospho-CoA kinase [Bacteroidota bacterium]